MNYIKHYIKLCRKCQEIKKDTSIYTERHHIFPKSIYGKNDKIVRITAKQHFIAHFLLWKACKKRYGISHIKTIKMGYAFYHMTITSKSTQQRYTSRSYQIIKEWYSKNNPSKYRDIRGNKNPMFGRSGVLHPLFGKPCSEERKKNIGLGNKNKLSGDKNPSKRQDVKDKISKAKKGISCQAGKLHPHYNHNITEELRNKLKEEWNICKNKESLYSFAKRNSTLLLVSRGCIQGIVYKSPNIITSSLTFS